MYSKTEPSGCLATSRSPLGPADGPLDDLAAGQFDVPDDRCDVEHEDGWWERGASGWHEPRLVAPRPAGSG